jgi:hypothetical protein
VCRIELSLVYPFTSERAAILDIGVEHNNTPINITFNRDGSITVPFFRGGEPPIHPDLWVWLLEG